MNYHFRVITTQDDETRRKRLNLTGCEKQGVEIILKKSRSVLIWVEGLNAPAANILKQQLLSLGADAAIHRDAIKGELHGSPVVIVSDERRLEHLPQKMAGQPFGLEALAEQIVEALKRTKEQPSSIPLPDGSIDLSNGPVVMGILNVTPDSFSDGGRYIEPERALERAREMVEEGAGIIDVGGESTRPGAKEVGEEEETMRVVPVIERIAGALDVPISIDTRKAKVAEAAIEAGAKIVNDVSALRHDPEMIEVVKRTGVPVVVMHMKGIPENMQDDPYYEDAVTEIIDWLEGKTAELMEKGMEKERIIVDPGIGFGKRLEDNLNIVAEFGDFRNLGFPLMVGYSRKSFLGEITGRDPMERVAGGLAALGRLLDSGAQIIRVHDVAETVDYIKVWKAIGRKG